MRGWFTSRRERFAAVEGLEVRPPAFDKENYNGPNVVERNVNIFKQ
jgi:hypothetical protein